MNAYAQSFDEVETAPLLWAMPIAPECTTLDASDESGGLPLRRIVAFPTSSAGAGVVSSTIATIYSAHLVRWMMTQECLNRPLLSDTKTGASFQVMHAVAAVKAWRAKHDAFGNAQTSEQAFRLHYFNFYDQVMTGSTSSLTTIGAGSRPDFDIRGNLGNLVIPDFRVLSGYDRYSVSNWDGHGAEAILPETIAAARSLLQILPSTFGEPDVAPAADGTIGLEWVPDAGSLRKLFIDVGPRTVWHSYWKFSDGTYGETQGLVSDADVSRVMKALFDKLSK